MKPFSQIVHTGIVIFSTMKLNEETKLAFWWCFYDFPSPHHHFHCSKLLYCSSTKNFLASEGFFCVWTISRGFNIVLSAFSSTSVRDTSISDEKTFFHWRFFAKVEFWVKKDLWIEVKKIEGGVSKRWCSHKKEIPFDFLTIDFFLVGVFG